MWAHGTLSARRPSYIFYIILFLFYLGGPPNRYISEAKPWPQWFKRAVAQVSQPRSGRSLPRSYLGGHPPVRHNTRAGALACRRRGPDDIPEGATLRNAKREPWGRYHMRYPAGVTPAGTLLSRSYRELSRHLLMVHNVWDAKSLRPQVASNRKRKQIEENPYVYGKGRRHPSLTRHRGTSACYTRTCWHWPLRARTRRQGYHTVLGDSDPTQQAMWRHPGTHYWRAALASRRQPEGTRRVWLGRTGMEAKTKSAACQRRPLCSREHDTTRSTALTYSREPVQGAATAARRRGTRRRPPMQCHHNHAPNERTKRRRRSNVIPQ